MQEIKIWKSLILKVKRLDEITQGREGADKKILGLALAKQRRSQQRRLRMSQWRKGRRSGKSDILEPRKKRVSMGEERLC